MKFSKSKIFLLYIIIFFFNDLRVPLFFNSWSLPASIIAIIGGILVLLLNKPCKFLNFSLFAITSKINPIKIYLFFCFYIFLVTLIKGFLGQCELVLSLIELTFVYIFAILSLFLINIYISSRILNPYKIMKIIYGTLYCILLLGIYDFVAYTTNLSILKVIHSLFFNVHGLSAFSTVFAKHYAFGFPRVQSVYFEPGYFAEYLFMFLPLFYTFSTFKHRIFKKRRTDKFIKKTTIPLVWINLILAQSPIWIVFAIISTLLFYKKIIIRKYKAISAIILILFSFFIISIKNINLEQTFLSRITTVLSNCHDINVLIAAEDSLGTRISCLINLLDIGSRTPVFGAGHSNLKKLMVEQIQYGKSKVFVTKEMYICILKHDVPTFQNPPLSNIFVRYGSIGILLYYLFLFQTVRALKISSKYANPTISSCCNAFASTIISIIILTCYDLSTINFMAYFLVGISLGLIQYVFYQYKNLKYK